MKSKLQATFCMVALALTVAASTLTFASTQSQNVCFSCAQCAGAADCCAGAQSCCDDCQSCCGGAGCC
jgi:hypothetical protein